MLNRAVAAVADFSTILIDGREIPREQWQRCVLRFEGGQPSLYLDGKRVTQHVVVNIFLEIGERLEEQSVNTAGGEP